MEPANQRLSTYQTVFLQAVDRLYIYLELAALQRPLHLISDLLFQKNLLVHDIIIYDIILIVVSFTALQRQLRPVTH